MSNLLDPALPITIYKHASLKKAKAVILHAMTLLEEASADTLTAVILSADLGHFRKYGRPLYGETWISEGDIHLPYAYLGSLAARDLRDNAILVGSWTRDTMILTKVDVEMTALIADILSPSDQEEIAEAVKAVREEGLIGVMDRLLYTAFLRSATDGRPLDWRMAIPGAQEGLTDRQVAKLTQEALFGQF